MDTIYRPVGARCAIDIRSLTKLIPREEILLHLEEKGFQVVGIDLVALARQCVRTATYRRGARFREAPEVMDCSSFTKWIYSQRGIWLPRRSIQQREMGEIIAYSEIESGDLVFASGRIDYYLDDPADGVGHVGIATGGGTVIHAANRDTGVVEIPLAIFAPSMIFRGARRIIPKEREILTVVIPPERDVETSDDIKWILLQTKKREVVI